MKPDFPPSKAFQDSPDDVPSEGRLLGLLSAGIYALFTLLPDSSSLMVAWPWVFVWQIGWLCPVVWLLWQIWQRRQVKGLGLGLDWIVALGAIGLIFSTLFAQYPEQARWYAWAVFGFIGAVYALNNWLSPERRLGVLVFQGYLSLVFILVSLGLWITQTYLPELSRLRQLQPYGVNLSFDFSVLELRNWAPIGHQNYVAGYLLLALPLLLGLSLVQTGWQRWLWAGGLALGLLDLYTTSSKGGWLGLLVLILAALVVIWQRHTLSRRWLGLGGVGVLAGVALMLVANNRWRNLITAIATGNAGGEVAFRLITNVTGWQMGVQQPWTGTGLGSVPLLYQAYRPAWAGREAEAVYQLHSTPAQLWAELGLWGIVVPLLFLSWLAVLSWRSRQKAQSALTPADQILGLSLAGSLLAYGVISLSDYQLDIVAISGTLVIFLAVIISLMQQALPGRSPILQGKPALALSGGGLGLILAAAFWLAPVHWAWNLSSQSFTALERKNLDLFQQRLSQAQRLAPWEAYYPYQLGWNLANLGLQAPTPQLQQNLVRQGTAVFQQGVAVAPALEFGHTNLGWLLLGTDPAAATQEFARAAQLMPAKRGVFYGLGLSLLAQGKQDQAITALSLETLRDPLWLTSPIWRSPQLQSLYPQVLARMRQKYQTLLGQYTQLGTFNTYLHQSLGGLYWWQGDFAAAQAHLATHGSPLSKQVLQLTSGTQPALTGDTPGELILRAWLNPAQRSQLVPQAWVKATQTVPTPEIQQQLLSGMDQATTLDQWLKQYAPIQQYRRERAGFGVLSRHIDGPAPDDFFLVVDNVAMTTFFTELLPSPVYDPTLDQVLQPDREQLIQSVLQG